jgi:stage II sporulation protein D
VVYGKGIPAGLALLCFYAFGRKGEGMFGWKNAVTVCAFSALCLSDCTAPGAFENSGADRPGIRVCLADQRQTETFRISRQTIFETRRAKAVVSDSATVFINVDSKGSLLVRVGSGNPVTVEGACRFYSSVRGGRFAYTGRNYSDTLLIVADGPRVVMVNLLPLENYLRGVVPNEIGRNRTAQEMEAVKAQAILARTYALAKVRLPLTRLYDVQADTRDQVFTGAEERGSVTADAVDATAGEVLEYDGRLAECYFHSTCGGMTEAVSRVWQRPQSKPYLVGASDGKSGREWCRISPSFRWHEEYTRQSFESILREYLGTAVDTMERAALPDSWSLLDIKIQRRMPSGRVATLKLVLGNHARSQALLVEADKIRWAIRRAGDMSVLRSTLFDLTLERDEQRWIQRLRLEGAGSGHGVGMCQWGAIGRARNGHSARRILQAYFPGTDIARRY